MSQHRPCSLLTIAILLLATPLLASDGVVYNGIDVLHTERGTFADFRSEPLPAGFFCAGSAPFRGVLNLKGVPIATGVPGALGDNDTIVQRLDDAVFNKKGVAYTRVQFKAMHLASIKPLKTACGPFNLRVTLDGQQPITTMRIVRENEKGGRFFAPLSLKVKLTFTPVDRKSRESFELVRSVRFPALSNLHWTFEANDKALQVPGYVQVDTDADGQADTYLPGTGNFAIGRRSLTKMTALPYHEDSCATHIVS